jgi:hypothetical protein
LKAKTPAATKIKPTMMTVTSSSEGNFEALLGGVAVPPSKGETLEVYQSGSHDVHEDELVVGVDVVAAGVLSVEFDTTSPLSFWYDPNGGRYNGDCGLLAGKLSHCRSVNVGVVLI